MFNKLKEIKARGLRCQVFRSFPEYQIKYVRYLDHDLETGIVNWTLENPLFGRIYYSEFWVDIHSTIIFIFYR